MSKYDGEPTVTVRKAEDVWFRCYCTKCGTYFDGVGTLASIRAEPVFKARCEGFNRKATESVALEAVKLGKLRPHDVEPYVLPENRPADWLALPTPLQPRSLQDSTRVGTQHA